MSLCRTEFAIQSLRFAGIAYRLDWVSIINRAWSRHLIFSPSEHSSDRDIILATTTCHDLKSEVREARSKPARTCLFRVWFKTSIFGKLISTHFNSDAKPCPIRRSSRGTFTPDSPVDDVRAGKAFCEVDNNIDPLDALFEDVLSDITSTIIQTSRGIR